MNLAQKLNEVTKTVETVPKNGRNEFHKYDYATIADVLRAVRGKLSELQVVVLTSVKEARKDGDITEVFTSHKFVDAETGETLEVTGYGQGHDKNDKGAFKARTGDRKYLLLETFLIPTGDDPEKDDPDPTKNGRKPSVNGRSPEQAPKQPTRDPNASTPHQHAQIKKLAGEVGITVEQIMQKMQLQWPPNKKDADRILTRLHEKKLELARA